MRERERDRETDRDRDRETDRQTDRDRDRQRQTDIQRERDLLRPYQFFKEKFGTYAARGMVCTMTDIGEKTPNN